MFAFIRILLLLVVADLLHAGNSAASSAGAKEGRSAEREKEEQLVRRLSEKEADISETVEELDRQISSLGEEEKEAARQLKSVAAQVSKLEGLIAEKEKMVGERKADAQVKVRELHRLYKGGVARLLFSSSSPADFLFRSKLLKAVIERDRDMLAKFREDIRLLQEKRQELSEKRSSYARIKEKIRSKAELVRQRRAEKQAMLKSVLKEKQLHNKLLAEIEKAERRMASTIASLGKGTGKGFAASEGKMPFPASGKVETPYGQLYDPQFNVTTFHKGLAIRAKDGSEVRSVFKGRVAFCGWFKGYGKIVIIDHGESYHTLYAHLSEVLVQAGEEVDTGERVGSVGDTGSLRGTLLYFELRHNGKPINPLRWVKGK